MYTVIDKKTKNIIHQNPAPLSQELKSKEVYALFDEKTMEIVRTEATRPYGSEEAGEITEDQALPLQEQVEKGLIEIGPDQKIEGNRIIDKTLEEKWKEGLIELSKEQKIENNRIVTKTLEEQAKEGLLTLNEPFEYIEKNEIKHLSVQEAIRQKRIRTEAQCREALDILNREMESRIHEKYSMSRELKITKDYLDWVTERKPKKDPRKETYLEMQAAIQEVKAEFQPVKDKLKKQLAAINDLEEENP